MRTLIALAVLSCSALAAPVPKELRKPQLDPRTEALINEPDCYRRIGEILHRFWFNDQPSHFTPERIYGGIL